MATTRGRTMKRVLVDMSKINTRLAGHVSEHKTIPPELQEDFNKQIECIRESGKPLDQFGPPCEAVVVSHDLVLVDGYVRYMAARKAGFTHIHVRFAK